MKNKRQGKHRARVLFRHIVLLLISFEIPVATAAEEDYCPASETYLAEIAKHIVTGSTPNETSCLIDYPSIAPDLSSYQIVDIRESQDSHTSIENAWKIPISELRTKEFLYTKSLLLVDDGFSRAQAINNCTQLTRAGFERVKILLGGADVLRMAGVNKRNSVIVKNPKTVSAKELVFEYFNGEVTLVSTSKDLAEQMKALGIETHYISRDNTEAIVDLAISESDGGFSPVILITKHDGPLDARLTQLPNVYLLKEGVLAVSDYLEQVFWTNHNRRGVPRRYMCGNA